MFAVGLSYIAFIMLRYSENEYTTQAIYKFNAIPIKKDSETELTIKLSH